ncbi:TadG family pilus assembly protein, partial [Escherichia coli]|uniref:TadG family pilus assembly protein n=1 Tax=Escherichia coli TaxID=562 RepID=UPI0028DDFC49
SRKLQGAADLAALAAARDLPNATAAAQATAAANALGSNVMVKVVTGVYTPDRTVPAAQRFQANAASPNAARVTVNSKADLFF